MTRIHFENMRTGESFELGEISFCCIPGQIVPEVVYTGREDPWVINIPEGIDVGPVKQERAWVRMNQKRGKGKR